MTDTEVSSKRKRKYPISFPNVSQEDAELILGFEFDKFYYYQIPIEEFLTKIAPEILKKEIFKRLIDCIESEGFPEATILPMNQSVVTDNVGLILQAIVSDCKRKMNRDDFKLSREKQIISEDGQVDGKMEFVIIQKIIARNTRYILVVEAKRDSLGKGLTQLLLALKSIWDVNNDQKLVYGFLTTGIIWQLVIYDGQTWKLSEPSTVLLGNMGKQEDRWLKNNTHILDIIYSILLSI